MKDLVIITAHCPSEEQEKMLERCIDSVINLNHHILLISHTHIPIHIQKKCNYYFYDYFNDINHDDELLYFVRYFIDDTTTIKSKYFIKEFYGFAIYRMFTIASQIANNFNYRNIHHIEYDSVLIDNSLIEEHNNLLNEYDSVFYTDDGKDSGFILGAFKSFKIDKLPKLFKEYDKDKMREIMVNTPLMPLETFTKQIFKESGNVIFRNSTELKNTGKLIQNESPSRLKYFTPYYDHRSDRFLLFYKNMGETVDSLRVYVNGEQLLSFSVQPKYWNIRTLCRFQDLNSLLLMVGNKIIYDKTFNEEQRNTLKENAYLIINEKNN
jgi:hypothetical protein